jgi:hypothetical protein
MPPAEKRKTPRIAPFVTPCRLDDGRTHIPGYMTDLSPRGARISCETVPPDPGSRVVLEIRFGRQVRYSRLQAEVKWIRPAAGEQESHTCGLTFTGVTAEEQRVLESIVDEFRRRAADLQ